MWLYWFTVNPVNLSFHIRVKESNVFLGLFMTLVSGRQWRQTKTHLLRRQKEAYWAAGSEADSFSQPWRGEESTRAQYTNTHCQSSHLQPCDSHSLSICHTQVRRMYVLCVSCSLFLSSVEVTLLCVCVFNFTLNTLINELAKTLSLATYRMFL